MAKKVKVWFDPEGDFNVVDIFPSYTGLGARITNNGDGTYNVLMSMTGRGQNWGGNATGWVGNIDIFNGDGSRADITMVQNISMERPRWSYPVYGNPGGTLPTYTVGSGVPGDIDEPPPNADRTFTLTQDVNYVDSDNDGLPDTLVNDPAYVYAAGGAVVDDGAIAGRRGSLSIDDEGTPTGRTVLIEDGRPVEYGQPLFFLRPE